ncbi:hypothetical protein [Lysobacter gummosus]|uniref:hypothetical protein n=1 Tax=Lysobacter gummosus TaxID=262324 RepID=UPI0036339898
MRRWSRNWLMNTAAAMGFFEALRYGATRGSASGNASRHAHHFPMTIITRFKKTPRT